MTVQGPRPLHYVDEIIHVQGAPSEHLRVATTQWGPVVGADWDGQPYALQWTAQDVAATNLNMIRLEHARSVSDALQAAAHFRNPRPELHGGRWRRSHWLDHRRLPAHPR